MILTVDGDAHKVANLLDLAAGQAEGPEIPEDKVIVSTTSLKLVAVRHQSVGHSSGVGNDLLSIGLPFGSGDLEESSRDRGDGLYQSGE